MWLRKFLHLTRAVYFIYGRIYYQWKFSVKVFPLRYASTKGVEGTSRYSLKEITTPLFQD